MELFGSSGTRGVTNEELTPEFATRVAAASGVVFEADRVALARDTRTSGPMLAAGAASGLTSVGADVDRLGVVPMPALQAYADEHEVPGVMITASHNPAEYNGLKLIGADGVELTVATLERIESMFGSERFRAPWDEVGTVRRVDGVRREYVSGILDAVDRDRIRDAALTVALDPGHGAGSRTSPEIFRELGCEVVTVNGQADGFFPGRDPEPVAENLDDLSRLVRSAGADVGVAHDGDADRAIFIDERGLYVEGDVALAALADDALEKGDVTVSAVNVSQRLVDVAANREARLDLTPIGSTRIITHIRDLQSAGDRVPVAGEGNGGILFPDYRLARDGAYTAARFLELIADRPVSDLVETYGGYANVRLNIEYGTADERAAMLTALDRYADSVDGDVTTLDGVRIDHGDAWVLARPSGTEPLIRIYAEARQEQRADELAGEMERLLQDARATA